MTKLIGTNANQVPSNADLGTAAFMDKKEFLLSKGSNVSAIDAIVVKSAIDVFVYDTSKDSDGGAWRKRTQNTTWYNEKLDTTKRGKRKEFPAVAVIVVESNKITIHDADDPTLPMWMVFNNSDNLMLGANPKAAVLRDGILWVALNGWGVSEISFVKDEAWRHRNNVASAYYGKFNGEIVNRNVISTFSRYDYIGALVNGQCHDIAVTVLPNAPIDPDSGLPVPTVAVATNAGITIIKNNGLTVNAFTGSSYLPILTVDFNENQDVVAQTGNTGAAQSLAFLSKDGVELDLYAYHTRPQISEFMTKAIPTKGNEVAFNKCGGQDHSVNNFRNGVSRLEHVSIGSIALSNHTNSMMNYITSDHNTGWMHGDIKIATLSDTDDTNVTGVELVTNSDFSSASSWSLGTGWSISGGKLRKSSNDNVSATQVVAGLVVGKTYQISVTVDTGSSSGYIYASGNYNSTQLTSAGTHTRTFIASSTSETVGVTGISANGLIVDSFSVRIAEEDRSVRGGYNGQALRVFGTITKTPVSPGSDIVAYSGFSSANYLETHLHGFTTSGTDPLCIIAWVKTTVDSSQIAYGLNVSNVYNAGSDAIGLTIGWSPGHWVERGQNVGFTENDVKYGQWQQMVIIRDSAKTKTYLDGKYTAVAQAGNALTATSVLRVGCALDGTGGFSGSVALLRISNTIPSDEQIAKIYNDERVLFQENAKATLYGSSDTVQALAYDDDTELLHVGTSAGRSMFRGLERVDNTTDAVGTSISVSNGLIAEE
jgi:hypothetical protein